MTSAFILLLPILLPLVGGLYIPVAKFRSRRWREVYIFFVVMATSLLALAAVIWCPADNLTLLRFSGTMSIAFRLDGLGRVFALMVAFLWPVATVYAFEYMKHEGKELKFYTFYTMTFGVTLAIAFAANLLTMYLFYELLTFITLPLVIHAMNRTVYAAGKKYLFYSIGGATLVFICLVFTANYGTSLDFALGGVFTPEMLAENRQALLWVFFLAFIGFGVKAAIFPFHSWLPAASVAPTTVTALLHAVAVVKAGAFTTMRLTYYIFGSENVAGTWVQKAVMALAIITILYGSAKAFYMQHFKRRLAYSTVSQLSYVLFGVTLMTAKGLAASIFYMVAHGFMKILLFYCCGSVLYMTRRTDVGQLEGLGSYMPVTFGTFTVGALALMGLPLTIGFNAKLELLLAAVSAGYGQAGTLGFVGIGVILISILLTAAYLFTIIRSAYFPREESVSFEPDRLPRDPNWKMKGPLILLAVTVILLGIFSQPLWEYVTAISLGMV
ncbi:MAG: proton-conducting transporter membrane subunit [Peptococcaceae bacterium]|nr:proton-conducting transporter membrane subunit [Peptococcaceae bacterium]